MVDQEPLAQWQYTCTEDEWLLCLQRTQRRAGPVRIGVQTGLLGLIALYCLIGFFTGGMKNGQSLFVGIAAIVVGIILLFVPAWRMRHDAQQISAAKKTIRIYLFEDGFAFGTPEEVIAFRECRPSVFDDMMLLQFSGDSVLPIPRRVATQEEWQMLLEKTAQAKSMR